MSRAAAAEAGRRGAAAGRRGGGPRPAGPARPRPHRSAVGGELAGAVGARRRLGGSRARPRARSGRRGRGARGLAPGRRGARAADRGRPLRPAYRRRGRPPRPGGGRRPRRASVAPRSVRRARARVARAARFAGACPGGRDRRRRSGRSHRRRGWSCRCPGATPTRSSAIACGALGVGVRSAQPSGARSSRAARSRRRGPARIGIPVARARAVVWRSARARSRVGRSPRPPVQSRGPGSPDGEDARSRWAPAAFRRRSRRS